MRNLSYRKKLITKIRMKEKRKSRVFTNQPAAESSLNNLPRQIQRKMKSKVRKIMASLK
jgi:hypothetical protein